MEVNINYLAIMHLGVYVHWEESEKDTEGKGFLSCAHGNTTNERNRKESEQGKIMKKYPTCRIRTSDLRMTVNTTVLRSAN